MNYNINENEILGIGGVGKYHTPKNGDVLTEVTLNDLLRLIDAPDNVEKAKAQWLIPSTLHTRVHKDQAADGAFKALWADIDTGSPDIRTVEFAIDAAVSEGLVVIYSSRSATEANKKWRVIIPLAKPLCGLDWRLCQVLLNNKLEAEGLTCDRSTEGHGQLCYLPNKGEFYECLILGEEAEPHFNVAECWQEELRKAKAKAEADETAAQSAKEAHQREAEAKRNQRMADGFKSPIDAFNALYSVEAILEKGDYTVSPCGSKFRHPASESGSFSAEVKDGRIHSFSSSDPLYTDGGGVGAHDAFSAFSVLFHSGDTNKALKDAADNWLHIEGVSWNKHHRQQQRNKPKAKLAGSPLDKLRGMSMRREPKNV